METLTLMFIDTVKYDVATFTLRHMLARYIIRARLHQVKRQRCDNSAMTLAILFSLKSMELLENRLQPHFRATPLFSMRTESQVALLSCCSVDADAWCKWALNKQITGS